MKNHRIAAKLLASLPGHTPRTPALAGTGQWLYWEAPSGESINIGVSLTVSGVTYRQLITEGEFAVAAEIWGKATAHHLGRLIEATSAALAAGADLPAGIRAEPISIVNGNTQAEMLDRLWRHGPARGVLLKKKPPSALAERSIEGGSTHEAEPTSSAPSTREQKPSQAQIPARTGAKDRKD